MNFTNEIVSFEIFLRKKCPNCPLEKMFMSDQELLCRSINVNSFDGAQEAFLKGVSVIPTVIFYDMNGNEVRRSSSMKQFEEVLKMAA